MNRLPKTYRNLAVASFQSEGMTVISLTNTKCTDSAAFYVRDDGQLFPFGSTNQLHKWYFHAVKLAKLIS